MKVCTVAPGFNEYGGVPYVARNLVAALAERGVESCVLTDQGQDPGVEQRVPDGMQITTVSRPNRVFPLDILSFTVRALPTLTKLHDIHEFDLVHVHSNYVLLPILAKLTNRIDVPVVGSAHGTYLNELRSFRDYPDFNGKWKYRTGVYLDHLIQKYGSRFVDHIHAVSTPAKPELEEMGIDPEKIVTVPNGIDLAEFDTSSGSIEVRADHGLEDAELAVSVGSVVPRKGVHTLIEAAPLVLERNPAAHIVHVGGGGHPGYTRYLEDLISKRDLGDAVTMTGRVTRAELLDWLRTADVAVSASYSEGCPINVLEAGASRCTVVATGVGGAPEILGDHGIYIEPGDTSSVTEGIADGFDRENGDAVRARIEEHFTWERVANQLYGFFQGWIS